MATQLAVPQSIDAVLGMGLGEVPGWLQVPETRRTGVAQAPRWVHLHRNVATDYAALSAPELVRRCAQTSNAAAWQEFVRRFHPLITGVVARTAGRWEAASRDLIDDLVQETYLKLCANGRRLLLQFRAWHADAVFGYLRVVTTNVVNDYFRARNAAKRRSIEIAVEVAQEIEGQGRENVERKILLQQVDGALQQVARRDRHIFWSYYREGQSARAIAAQPSIRLTTKGVESAIMRLTRLVRSRLAPTLAPCGRE